ncbi:hypothetical protein LX83_003108 [Goodfellowiella coeruleoviolacea]|uniref:SIMPL domain-containing protein n=1 Tax=Goodfellowiella coeruleoviolacea TaxID=334858 RepID=A0AAE3KHA1_9PSEU|nr:hypothetical protein [Goodfellowiella coeruleoviolacea]
MVTRGVGRVERAPDRAGLSVSYSAPAASRGAAIAELSRRVTPVEESLTAVGVQVRARRLSVNAAWENGRQVGCRAEQYYELRVDGLTLLEEVLGQLIAAEPATLHGPFWELADTTEAVREAQRHAVVDARRRAAGYAEALAARLGPLLRLTDGDAAEVAVGYGSAMPVPGGAGAWESVRDIRELNLAPQPVTVSATCTATWTLLD